VKNIIEFLHDAPRPLKGGVPGAVPGRAYGGGVRGFIGGGKF